VESEKNVQEVDII